MKLKIEVLFKDKNNGRIYEKGEVVEFADGRAEELLSDERHLVSKIEEPATKPKQAEEKTKSKRTKK